MDVLTRFGLEKSRFTVLMMLLILVMGALSYQSLPKRSNPAITIRTAVVAINNEGMSPERMEDLIAIPVERKIREIGAVDDIETILRAGESLFFVTLGDGVSIPGIADAWEDLRNKMSDVQPELPSGSQGPFVNTDYGDVAIATIAITGEDFPLNDLEVIAEDLQTDLYQLDGIAKVELYGVQEERIWLSLDIRKLASVGVQIEQLLADLQEQNVILPAGTLDAGGTRIELEANGDLRSVDEIRGVLTKAPGLAGFVRMEDLVEVERGYQDPPDEPAFFNGRPAIVAAVQMTDGTDIQVLGRALAERIQRFEDRQPIGVSLDVSTFEETNVTDSIQGALTNVGQTFLVVLGAMLLFLGLRAAIVIASIVPFTICFALAAMTLVGISVEQVSIAAVIISLGLLVDNGLVVVEDIEGQVNVGTPVREAAMRAGKQYAVPLGVASITTVSAFLPMLLIEGTEGEFAFSLGSVVAAMLLGSWISALYILPFLCTLVLRKKASASGDPPAAARAYGSLVNRLIRFGIPIVAIVYGLVALSATQMGNVKSEMFPLSDRADFLVYMDMPSETAISETERHARLVQDWLSDPEINPGVVNSTVYVGGGGPRFYLSLSPANPDPASAFFAVNTATVEDAIETVDRARRVFVEQFPAARFRVTRLSQGGSESGIVEIEISGPDADVLLAAGREVEAGFADLPALVQNESDWGSEVIKVVVDIAQDKARELGVTSQDISEVMDAYFSGTAYSTFRDGDAQIPIVLRATTGSRDSIEDLANLTVVAGGELISIAQVADFRPQLEFSKIRRFNQQRRIVVSAKSDSLSAAETLAHIQPVLDGLDLGPAYTVETGGEIADSADVYGKLGANLPIALAVMLAALVFQFNSGRRSLATFMTIPIVLIGAPYALLIAGQPLSFFAVLGLVSLMGIIINNAIVMIDQVDIERQSKPLREAIVSAAVQRARPIMLTSVTTVFGLLPMALTGGALFEPMATIMIGGLLIASPLTLFFVPALLYLLLGTLTPKRRSAEAA